MAREQIDGAVSEYIGVGIPAETHEHGALLLLSDPHRSAQMHALLSARGLRCVVARNKSAALDRVLGDISIGVVIAEMAKADPPEPMIVSELRQSCLRPLAAILLVPDPSYALLRQIAQAGPADILPEQPAAEELVQAVEAALGWYRRSLGMGGLSQGILRMLAQIEAQLGRLIGAEAPQSAESLRQRAPLAIPAPTASRPAHPGPVHPSKAGVDRETIKAIMRVHSAQAKLLGYGLVDDAAWVMLLDLLLMHLEGKTLAVTSLCVGSGVPVTTALRRLDQLISKGLAVKNPDRADRRRLLVSITPKGIDCVSAIVEHMQGELRTVVAA